MTPKLKVVFKFPYSLLLFIAITVLDYRMKFFSAQFVRVEIPSFC